mmetsp:Transcript_27366/g.73999  ORF Transcript_27366/g.73999 Transcript_27366/m.73999 type:complete len:284 (-) Transcript_27366:55-906(-)
MRRWMAAKSIISPSAPSANWWSCSPSSMLVSMSPATMPRCSSRAMATCCSLNLSRAMALRSASVRSSSSSSLSSSSSEPSLPLMSPSICSLSPSAGCEPSSPSSSSPLLSSLSSSPSSSALPSKSPLLISSGMMPSSLSSSSVPIDPGPEPSLPPTSSSDSSSDSSSGSSSGSSCCFLFLGVGFSHFEFSSVKPPLLLEPFLLELPLVICCLGVAGADTAGFFLLGLGVTGTLLACFAGASLLTACLNACLAPDEGAFSLLLAMPAGICWGWACWENSPLGYV